MRPHNHSVSLAESERHIIDSTNSGGALDDGVKHRLHVRGRAADDAEYLSRRRLVLQGFAQFCVALLDFLEQPHILDVDDSLIGEGFQELDLLVREWADFHPANPIAPNCNPLTEQWCSQMSPNTDGF